jgi:ABC-type Zn uptake system ZnuABC Zn-binding protein ZnuA
MPQTLITGLSSILMLVLLLGIHGFVHAQSAGERLRVTATVPELGSLAREVGGEQVSVIVLVKGTEDPHFIEAKPSFVKDLSQADAFLLSGMDLELGWAPVLIQGAANHKIVPGAMGYIDASTVITPLDVPAGQVDRSMGDIHVLGNPHYLSDPLNGLRVAALLREKFSALRPAAAAYFSQRYTAFRARLGSAMVGDILARKYDFEKLALLFEHGQLAEFLRSQGDLQSLSGWLGTMLPYAGTKAVADHNLWPYFARRFGLLISGLLEPKPGIQPTTKHLRELIQVMQTEKISLILASVYYDPRHAQFVAQHTRAKIVNMANQVGARQGTDDYLQMIDYNIRQLTAVLQQGR